MVGPATGAVSTLFRDRSGIMITESLVVDWVDTLVKSFAKAHFQEVNHLTKVVYCEPGPIEFAVHTGDFNFSNDAMLGEAYPIPVANVGVAIIQRFTDIFSMDTVHFGYSKYANTIVAWESDREKFIHIWIATALERLG